MAQLVILAFFLTVILCTSEMAVVFKGICLIALSIVIWLLRGCREDDEMAFTFASLEVIFAGVMGSMYAFMGLLSSLIFG